LEYPFGRKGQAKRASNENLLDKAPQIPIISNYIIEQMVRFNAATKNTQFTKSWKPLDDFFRKMIDQINDQHFA
jgi:hypothetical protein